MSSKLQKKLRQLVNRQLRTDVEDTVNILCKQNFYTRWYFGIRIIFAAKSKVLVPLSVIKDAEKR